MAEYINLDDMLEQFDKRASKLVEDRRVSVEAMREFIFNRPKANVKEIVYAHWICKPDCGVTECSHCHRSLEEYVEYPYCMYCGAEMSEVNE